MKRGKFKNNIAIYRKALNYSQSDLAFFINVSQNTISSFERQVYQPSAFVAYKLCRCLGVSFEKLFYWED